MSKKRELRQGGHALARKANRRKGGLDSTSTHTGSFDQGHATGQNARDPESNATPNDVRKRVRREYEGLSPEERQAYKKGYAQGSH